MKRNLVIVGLGAIFLLLLIYVARSGYMRPLVSNIDGIGTKDATYEIDGKMITLKNGIARLPVGNSSTSQAVTYFGNAVAGDFDGDGLIDEAFILTEDTGGTGTFYYVVVALRTASGYRGTNAIFLGDRIAPQTTEFKSGQIIVNYADRKPGEPFSVRPSVGVSKYFKVVADRLTEVPSPKSSK